MSEVPTQKVFIMQDNTATVICPNCSSSKRIDASKLKGLRGELRLKCNCGSSFNVFFEYRKVWRKQTSVLPGTYMNVKNKVDRGRIQVKNISSTGVGFTINVAHHLNIGDNILVKFTLDDPNCSELEIDAIVRRVIDKYIGCEISKESQKNLHVLEVLGFYLMR